MYYGGYVMKVNTTKLLKRREKLMFNFFFKVKSKAAILFFLGMVVLGVGAYFTLENKLIHYILGSLTALCLLCGLLSLLHVFNGNISIAELEEIIKHDRQIAYDGLFKNLAIRDNKADFIESPLEVVCPDLYPGRNTIVYRYMKKNNKVYYSQTGYNWLLFGKDSLFHYTASVNHIYGYVGYEVAEEVRYTDVVNVKTVVSKENNCERLTLYLSLVNGTEVKLILRNLPNQLENSTRQLSDVEANLINTVRRCIRNNK